MNYILQNNLKTSRENKVDLVSEGRLQGKTFLRLIPLGYFMEMHDPLNPRASIENGLDFHLDDENESVVGTRKVERGEFLIKKR